ncbi:LysR family transcriptional regulator [Mycobacterium decipiens]|uniref:Probable hydrogen peroxide-inducible genes activator n=1 Tax=Mycobacterium decipiens TaxID=1430326 RepID=A0A1X2LYG0_9MYCO|nr:LysR family transcriptional regulator [Mycobacterium decipiens]OSC42268.1 LysR family transcriptional regulator [Mycobacterium decipiens]
MIDNLGFSLTQLRYFVVSAELGNISEAAEKLYVSQSTVSSALMRLERELGVHLFVRRHARGVALTPSGRHLLQEARTLLGQARILKAQSVALAGDTAGPLDVGCFFSIAPFLLPVVCNVIKERHMALQLNIHEGSADRLLKFLQDGRCELVVTYEFLSGDSRFRPLVELPIYGLLPHDDPCGDVGSIGLAELASRPLVTLNTPGVLHHFENLFAHAEVEMPQLITTTSIETMRGLVAAGSGFSLMYQRASNATTLGGGKVREVEIAEDLPASCLGVAMLPDLAISNRGKAFLDVLGSMVAVPDDVNSIVRYPSSRCTGSVAAVANRDGKFDCSAPRLSHEAGPPC